MEALAKLSPERSGRSPTLQNTNKTACFLRWRDDLRVVRGSFARASMTRKRVIDCLIPLLVALRAATIPAQSVHNWNADTNGNWNMSLVDRRR
jgi:hypothetical protein